ncbi:MAG: HlyD family efflux transporter periplasmic adaptor subunit, partial [Planctomycetota bacterium]
LWLCIALAWGVVKILHEFGHALACKSIGRDCHEMGIMMLAFVPCLYCNVSDIWMEPNRWKRMLVSFAGIYVEMFIAALCVPLWLISQEGPAQIFLLSVILIGSINTLFINGNPLLRYDGYYLLSDWMNIPNLQSHAQKELDSWVSQIFFKTKSSELTRLSGLVWFGGLSKVYRLLIVAIIVAAIYGFFSGLRLPNLGFIVASVISVTSFGRPVQSWVSKQLQKVVSGRMRTARIIGLALVGAVLMILIAMYPLRPKVIARGSVIVSGEGVIYAPESGTISWRVKLGELVDPGQELAYIANDALAEKIRLQSQWIEEIDLDIENLKLIQKQGEDYSAEIKLREKTRKGAQEFRDQLIQQSHKLRIESPCAGKLAALPEPMKWRRETLDLARGGTLLDHSNQNAVVQAGEPLASIQSRENQRILLNVDAKEIGRVQAGQKVIVYVWQHSPEPILGVVEATGIENDFVLGENGLNQESVAVSVKLENGTENLMLRSRVDAAIETGQLRYYQWLHWWASQHFRW